ncbi:hypothetical protein GGF46_005146 [Coemansia sp. RSA 552]|nr:hypothetical protein GGF46_005146 [Coemansia sp. RSA 552]
METFNGQSRMAEEEDTQQKQDGETQQQEQQQFVVSHQLVSLDIDFDRQIVKGLTDLSVEVKTADLKELRLHCERPAVRSVSMDGVPCEFRREDPTTRRKLVSKLLRSNEAEEEVGSLVIQVPLGVELRGPNGFRTVKVRIEFYLVEPKVGIVFSSEQQWQTVHTETRMYPSATRQWVPCVDTRDQRSTWDLYFAVPACMRTAEEGVLPLTVVASGELHSLVEHPRDPLRRIFRYVMSTATAAYTLGFAVGPFTSACSLDGKLLANGEDEGRSEQGEEEAEGAGKAAEGGAEQAAGETAAEPAKASHNSKLRRETVDAVGGVFAFTYPGAQEILENTCSFIPEALAFYSQEFGSYPFATYKLVFMEGLGTEVITCASLTLVGTGLLHPRTVIEQAYETRRSVGVAVAQQWFGMHVGAATWGDWWVVAGLAGYAAGQFVRHNLGVNEHRYRLRRDMTRVCHADVNQKPLSYRDQGPVQGEEAEFVGLKAPIVLYMIDRRMMKGGMSLGLQRVVPKILVSAISGKLEHGNAVSTGEFLRLCRRVSGVDLKAFAEQWVYGTGCPVFHVSYAFNRKKLAVEITMHQESTNAAATAPWARPQLFHGQMTARIREADGTPYEHVLDIHRGDAWKKFEVQFNTKYKRIRRSTKRFHMRQMAAAAEEQNVNAEVLGMDDEETAIALFGAEDEREKRDWRVVEWGEDDEESLASATFEWIRMDSDLEWACVMHFEQPDFMWAAQLQKDRDVVAQLDAVDALQHQPPSAAASTTLMRTVMDARVFYRVRVDAALALARFATQDLDWIGLHHLVRIYKRRYCVPPGSDGSDGSDGSGDSEDLLAPRLPRPNNFANIGEYFTQKAVLAALSNIRCSPHGEAPLAARRLVLAALRYNDNSENVYSDCYFQAALVRSLANGVIASSRFGRRYALGAAQSGDDDDAVLNEIERLRKLDALAPSYRNVVSAACIDVLLRLSLVQPTARVFNSMLFYGMASPDTYADARRAALGGLLLHWGVAEPWAAQFFIARAAEDPVAARFLMEVLVLRAMAFGQQHRSLLFIEEQGSEATEHIDTDARLVGGLESLIDSLSADTAPMRTLLASVAYDSSVADAQRMLLALLHMLIYHVADCSIPPPTAASRKKLKIKLGGSRAKARARRVPGTSVRPPSRSNASSDSEDMPLALAMSKEEVDIMSTDDHQRHGLPLIAGTRPPPIAAPDNRLNSPAYIEPSPKEEAPVKLKLKLKLGKPSPPATPSMQSQSVVVRERSQSRHPSAFPFLRPVDVVLDGCPTYYDVVKEPMDLGTVKLKLESQKYTKASEVEGDVRLMLNNCYLFNPAGTPVHAMGKQIEELFEAEWARVGEPIASKRGAEGESPATPQQAQAKRQRKKSFKDKPAEPKKTPRPRKQVRKKAELGDDPDAIMAYLDRAPSPAEPKEGDWWSACRRALLHVMAQPSALEFMVPVDPVRQNVPTYLDIVKTPMDLGTVRKKLDRVEYASKEAFYADVELVFTNCFLFNPPNTFVHSQGQALQRIFESTWEHYVPLAEGGERKIPPDVLMGEREMERAKGIVNKLRRDDTAWPFLTPVDPVALGVPTYFDIVKNPMDLSTVLKKLAKKAYPYAADFVADLQLIVDDCFLFNFPDTPVHECGKALLAGSKALLEPDHWDRWLAPPLPPPVEAPSNIPAP